MSKIIEIETVPNASGGVVKGLAHELVLLRLHIHTNLGTS